MTEAFIHQFIHCFFKENGCHVKNQTDGKINVTLTEEMDKAITNRPFYWKYMEATNQQGTPLELTFAATKEKQDNESEWVTYGSPRLQQLSNFLENQARFVRLFQVRETNQQTLLEPWLLLNYRLTYKGKQKKEMLFSFGLNLINGAMVSGMMEQLNQLELNELISDHCYTISPLIKLRSGYLRIEKYVDTYVERDNHNWAIQSYEKLKKEINMIDYFYGNTADDEAKEREVTAAKQRLEPAITHKVISGGLVYLDQHFLIK